jgi:hypothetical protein
MRWLSILTLGAVVGIGVPAFAPDALAHKKPMNKLCKATKLDGKPMTFKCKASEKCCFSIIESKGTCRPASATCL